MEPKYMIYGLGVVILAIVLLILVGLYQNHKHEQSIKTSIQDAVDEIIEQAEATDNIEELTALMIRLRAYLSLNETWAEINLTERAVAYLHERFEQLKPKD